MPSSFSKHPIDVARYNKCTQRLEYLPTAIEKYNKQFNQNFKAWMLIHTKYHISYSAVNVGVVTSPIYR